jgi:hypothetical protein
VTLFKTASILNIYQEIKENFSLIYPYFSLGTTGTDTDRSHLRLSAKIFRAVFIRSFCIRPNASSSVSSKFQKNKILEKKIYSILFKPFFVRPFVFDRTTTNGV